MDLVNEAIKRLSSPPNRSRRSHHKMKKMWNESKNGIKEALQKASEIDIYKNGMTRAKRDTVSAKSKVKDIINDFKIARDALNKQYDWKHYNATELWPTRNVSKFDWNIHNNPNKTDCLANDSKFNNGGDCKLEIGITSACFGFFIVILCLFLKFSK